MTGNFGIFEGNFVKRFYRSAGFFGAIFIIFAWFTGHILVAVETVVDKCRR